MNKKLFILFLAAHFIYFNAAKAQIVNATFEWDKQDIEHVLSLQGIEVYKMPIPQDGHLYNLFMIHYKEDGNVDTFNFYERLKENLPEELAKSALIQNNSPDEHLRFYFKYQTDTLLIKLVLPGISMDFHQEFKNTGNYKTGAKAFDMPEKAENMNRILVLYNSTSEKMHCAMEDSDLDLKKRMKSVISFYLQPI